MRAPRASSQYPSIPMIVMKASVGGQGQRGPTILLRKIVAPSAASRPLAAFLDPGPHRPWILREAPGGTHLRIRGIEPQIRKASSLSQEFLWWHGTASASRTTGPHHFFGRVGRCTSSAMMVAAQKNRDPHRRLRRSRSAILDPAARSPCSGGNLFRFNRRFQ